MQSLLTYDGDFTTGILGLIEGVYYTLGKAFKNFVLPLIFHTNPFH